ncbi:MAG: hypothetical protein PVJ28_05695 [Acidimicrobiia bacterium]
MSASSTFRAMTLLVVVGLIAAGCSSGPSAETAAFCDDYVAVQGLITSGPDEADPMPWVEGVTAGLEGLKADAPEEISGAVTGMADTLLEPVGNLDEEAFFAATMSESYTEDAAVVNGFVVDECEFSSIEVTAIDYAYDADLDGLEAGQVAFDFSNEGTEFHEMALLRINDDTTETVEELLELPEEEAMAKTTFMGISFAAPGEGSTMYADLEEGRYVMICFIPQGSTSLEAAETAEGPPHFTQGMLTEFTVEG